MIPSQEAMLIWHCQRNRITQFTVQEFKGGRVMVFWEDHQMLSADSLLELSTVIEMRDSSRVDRWDFRDRDEADLFVQKMALSLALEDLRDQYAVRKV